MLRNIHISTNFAEGTSGAMIFVASDVFMTNSDIVQNRALKSGGGLFFIESFATITRSQFQSNDSNGPVS
jgi:hypothetical protein